MPLTWVPVKSLFLCKQLREPYGARELHVNNTENPGRLDVMDQESLNERETRAWVRYQHMRIEVNVVLARMLTRDFGLTEADFVILLRLSNSAEYRLRAREMAAALQWDRSRLSRQVSRMEARGAVMRTPSEGDARGYDVALTEAGRAAFQAAWPSYVQAFATASPTCSPRINSTPSPTSPRRSTATSPLSTAPAD
jgi:DNA-binding MarR family transcriptional regulator